MRIPKEVSEAAAWMGRRSYRVRSLFAVTACSVLDAVACNAYPREEN